MFYFNSLPIINYNNDTMRDVFKRIVVQSETNTDWYDIYRMNDDETFHDISYKLYGTINYWWLLCIINNVKDYHYDAVIPTKILQRLAQDHQVLEIRSLKDYILIPKNTDVELSNDYNTRGRITDKYYKDGKFYMNVELYNVYNKFPTESEIKLSTDRLAKIRLNNSGMCNVGDLVRQDFSTNDDSIESFARGHVVWKEDNNIYLYKTKISDFVLTGISQTINNKETTASSLNILGKPPITDINILEVENLREFSVSSSLENRLDFLSKYDELENINNTKSMIKVIKKEQVNRLQNIVLNQLG